MQTTQATKSRTTTRDTKKAKLLSNPDVKRWHDNVARGSPVTADGWLRKLNHFCELHDLTPMQLVEIGLKEPRNVTDLLEDHVTMMESEGKAPQYIISTITAAKSWLRHFDIEIKRKIRIANVDSTPTLQEERVPEGNELTELFNRANLRVGAAMALIAKSGLRPEVLGNHNASDGLTIKDLPDLAIVQGRATFINTPPRVIVRRALSKAGHQYFTFLSDIGAKRLLAYLNQRILDGEALTPDTPVIGQFQRYRRYRGINNGKPFAETQTILKEIRKTMRPRFAWRPYVLRAFFDTELLIAESRGKIAHDFRVFFMGHKGSIEAKYPTNKGILPKALMDEMRDAFRRSEEFLDLEKCSIDPLEKQKEEVKAKLETMGHDELQKALELLRKLGSGESSESSDPKKQSLTSTPAGNTPETYQMERWSSENRSRDNSSRESLWTRSFFLIVNHSILVIGRL